MVRVVGIDVGIVNLGMVVLKGDPSGPPTVESLHLVNLTQLPHRRVSRSQCTLHHSSKQCDWVSHFIQEFKDLFDSTEKVVIEQQPPRGIQGVEQLLLHHFREKVVSFSPVFMHRLLGIRHLDYEQRKEWVTTQFSHVLEETPHLEKNYTSLSRRHDVADAYFMAKLWWDKEQKRLRDKRRTETFKTQLDFDRFMYKGDLPPNKRQRHSSPGDLP